MRWFIAGIATEQYIFIDKFCRILSNQKLKKASSTHTGEYSNTPCLPILDREYILYVYIYTYDYICTMYVHLSESVTIHIHMYIYIYTCLWCYPCTHALCFRSLSLKKMDPSWPFCLRAGAEWRLGVLLQVQRWNTPAAWLSSFHSAPLGVDELRQGGTTWAVMVRQVEWNVKCI